MSDESEQQEAAERSVVEIDPIRLSASSSLSVTEAVISGSQSSGVQTFSVEQIRLEQKGRAEAHRHAMERERLENEESQKQHERKKDWIIFCLVVCAMAGGLLFGVALNFMSVNQETKRWGQSLIILIIGALGGYITGSKTS